MPLPHSAAKRSTNGRIRVRDLQKVRNLFMEIGVQEIQGKREPGAYSMRERQHIFGELAKILDETQRAKLRDLIINRGASQQAP